MNLDQLRREAASMGLVLIEERHAEKIVHHVAGIFNERMRECKTAMLEAAEDSGRNVTGWRSLADAFEHSVETMAEIVAECERIVHQDPSGEQMVTMTYGEEGYTVHDYEYNERWEFATEREAMSKFEERCDAQEGVVVSYATVEDVPLTHDADFPFGH